jgi:uncharacterized protein with NRDE domain
MALLRAGNRERGRELLSGLDARQYNPFNLLFGDAGGLLLGYGRSDRAAIELAAVPEGVHVLPNDRLDSPDIPKVETIHRRLRGSGELGPKELRARLADVLADTGLADPERVEAPPPGSPLSAELAHRLSAIAIETERYGTRSSAIVALQPGTCAGFWYADGPPQRTAMRDMGDLLAQL